MTKPEPVPSPVWVDTSMLTTAGSSAAAIPATESGARSALPAGPPVPRLAPGSRAVALVELRSATW